MRIAVIAATLFGLLVFTAAAAQAGIVIDTRPGTGSANIDTAIWVGQTFTAEGTTLLEFGFLLADTGTDNLFFSGAIYETASGVPTGSALFTSSATEVTTNGTYSFSPNLALSKGSVYAITAQVTAGDGAFGGTGSSIYSGGTFIHNAGSGTSWFASSGQDGAVLISMTPEPSSLLLFGLGLTVTAVMVRRSRKRA